jgi:RNA polymerase sigma-70 factor (ECF subfamily)
MIRGKAMLDRDARSRTFEAAALPHLNDLFQTAVRLIGNRTEAEDIVQDTYLLAWKCFDCFEAGTNCRAWLFGIMFNATRHHRRKWFDRKIKGNMEEVLENILPYTPPIPAELSDEEVLSALDGIPEHFRAVVLLADVQEFSYKEVAEILKVPVGTVMSRLNRSRRLLRIALGGFARSYGINKRCPAGAVQA